eukprot:TRINITY_DN3008_c0_g1_i5.p3 TRINITY_DN3008_c0_g1~~TRINITY_DN3008_c0_g1_i5.p3  ORF type:complete len:133 (-),score=17.44 TRINITY_DN3008_c0_g1_i5:71-469(-)
MCIRDRYKELDELNSEEQTLNQHIEHVQIQLEEIAQDENNAGYAFVTYHDLCELSAAQPGEDEDKAFLVFGAPKGTTLEVPYWDQEDMNDMYRGYPYRLYLDSCMSGGEISVFVISDGMNARKKKSIIFCFL